MLLAEQTKGKRLSASGSQFVARSVTDFELKRGNPEAVPIANPTPPSGQSPLARQPHTEPAVSQPP